MPKRSSPRVRRCLAWSLAVGLCACARAAPVPALPALPSIHNDPRAIGTPHPFMVFAADPQGEWLGLCQARRDTDRDGKIDVGFEIHGGSFGDRLEPYLVRGAGPGEPIDDYLGRDPSGRWVALTQAGRAVLLDMRTGRRKDLPPDSLARSIVFGEAHALLRRREPATGAEVFWLDLGGGTERRISLGEGLVWHARPTEGDSWIHAAMVVRDRNGNGKLDLPEGGTDAAHGLCTSPAASLTWSTRGPQDDAIEHRWLPPGGGPWLAGPDLLSPFGSEMLRRLPDGSVVVEARDGRRTALVPQDCRGELEEVSAKHRMVIAQCDAESPPDTPTRDGDAEATTRKTRLVAFHVDSRRLDLPPEADGTWPVDPLSDVVFLSAGEHVLMFDTAGWQVVNLGATGICAQYGRHVMYDGPDGIWFTDLAIGASHPLFPGGRVDSRYARSTTGLAFRGCAVSTMQRGRWALADIDLIDLVTGRVVGRIPDRDVPPITISMHGRVLLPYAPRPPLPADHGGTDQYADVGPLQWVDAAPIPHAEPR